jgi:hypothetical protein
MPAGRQIGTRHPQCSIAPLPRASASVIPVPRRHLPPLSILSKTYQKRIKNVSKKYQKSIKASSRCLLGSHAAAQDHIRWVGAVKLTLSFPTRRRWLTLADWEPRVTPSQLSTYSRKKSHFEHVRSFPASSNSKIVAETRADDSSPRFLRRRKDGGFRVVAHVHGSLFNAKGKSDMNDQ